MTTKTNPNRTTCPVCNGTRRLVPLDEDFKRTGPEEDCVDCADGTVIIITSH